MLKKRKEEREVLRMAIFHLSFSNGKVGKGLAHFKYIMGEDKYLYKENEVIYEKHNMPPHLSAEDFGSQPMLMKELMEEYIKK